MNLSLNKLTISAILMGGVIFTSCQQDAYEIPASELYTREFIKQFGVFDSSHDWNMATHGSVAVTTASPTNVKVYAVVDGKRYIFAKRSDVTGNQTIEFDIPKNVDKLIVRVNGKDYNVDNGASLDLRSRTSRTFGAEGSAGNGIEFKVSNEEIFPIEAMKSFISVMPEQDNNVGKQYTGEDGVERKVISNFHFVGTGEPITFYPLYWNTSSFHALGVYWLNDDGKFDSKNMKDLYYTKSGELTHSTDYTEKTTEIGHERCYESGNLNAGEICSAHNSKVLISTGNELLNFNGYIGTINSGDHYHEYTKTIEANPGTWNTADISKDTSYDENITKAIKTKGITLTVPTGLKYGFYLKVSPDNSINPERKSDDIKYQEDKISHIVFSQAIRNQIYGTAAGAEDIWDCTSQKNEITDKQWANVPAGDEYVQASFLQIPVNGKKYLYFAFEDWKLGSPDLNDLVFIFDDDYEPEDIPVIDEDEPEDEPYSWIIAAEDLGNLDDFDFNDVVFSVSTPLQDEATKEWYVTVEALAAGGTLPIWLEFEGATVVPDDLTGKGDSYAEWHNWFIDKDADFVTSSIMINTHGGKDNLKGRKARIKVPEGFSLAEKDKTDAAHETDRHMGGFRLKVERADGTYHYVLPPKFDPSKKHQIASEAPQMICLPGGWRWPVERMPIYNSYVNFIDWCKDKNVTDWHKNGVNCY